MTLTGQYCLIREHKLYREILGVVKICCLVSRAKNKSSGPTTSSPYYQMKNWISLHNISVGT